jgi:hypothetical protein
LTESIANNYDTSPSIPCVAHTVSHRVAARHRLRVIWAAQTGIGGRCTRRRGVLSSATVGACGSHRRAYCRRVLSSAAGYTWAAPRSREPQITKTSRDGSLSCSRRHRVRGTSCARGSCYGSHRCRVCVEAAVYACRRPCGYLVLTGNAGGASSTVGSGVTHITKTSRNGSFSCSRRHRVRGTSCARGSCCGSHRCRVCVEAAVCA